MRNSNEYYRQYNKNNLKRISLSLSLVNDKDIIEAIERESPDNIQAGVKALIRKGIKYTDQEKCYKQLPC